MEQFLYSPDWQQKRKKKPEKKSVTFGDGYTQHIGIGANKLRQPYDVVFTGSFTRIWAIEQFLEARGGVEDFQWTTNNGVTLTVYCDEWSVDYSTYNNIQLTTTFKQR